MLEFQGSTILFTLINLVVLYLFLRKFLFGRVNAILEQRAQKIQRELETAQQERTEAQELKVNYEQQLAQARDEAERMVADARLRGQRLYESKVQEAQKVSQRIQKEAEGQIAQQRAEMLQGVRNEVTSLALMAAEKVACHTMDTQQEKAMIDAFLLEVGEHA